MPASVPFRCEGLYLAAWGVVVIPLLEDRRDR
jgi:hypothetical protein